MPVFLLITTQSTRHIDRTCMRGKREKQINGSHLVRVYLCLTHKLPMPFLTFRARRAPKGGRKTDVGTGPCENKIHT